MGALNRAAIARALAYAGLAFAAAAQAHGPAEAPASPGAAAGSGTVSSVPAALAARYRVALTLPGTEGRATTQVHDGYLIRGADQVAYLRGTTEDIWHRDPQGGVHLERVFRADRRVVDYPASELRALQIDADWQALGTLIDERDLTRLKPAGKVGAGPRLRYHGQLRGERVALTWDPALRLPVELRRDGAGGRSVRYRLVEAHPAAPLHWPQPGAGSDDFLRLDAADFGDMGYDDFVRKAESRDVRVGWRAGHGH